MVDINEYERIVKQYRKQLFKYCYYRLYENIVLTEETFDDIIHVLYKKWDTLDLDGNIRAWLYAVADREIKQALKKHEKYYRHNSSLEESLECGELDLIEHNDEYFTEDEVSVEEYINQIKDSLPDEYKRVFVYRYIEKKTLVETSRLTGIPYSSLRLRINKLDRMIRAEIKKIFK